jgi:polyisoprenoid-binding protein YceI
MTSSIDSVTRDWDGLTIPAAGTYLLDAAHKRVGFVARHMMVSKVRGEFADATATITVAEDPLESSVTATIQAASITTGQADRDGHLRSGDFLEAEAFPTLEYRSTGVKSHDGNEFVLSGELTIKGVTRPVDLKVEFEGVGRSPYGQDIFGFSASTEIDREDFGLTWNVALETGGVVVGKKIKIEIEGEAIRQACSVHRSPPGPRRTPARARGRFRPGRRIPGANCHELFGGPSGGRRRGLGRDAGQERVRSRPRSDRSRDRAGSPSGPREVNASNVGWFTTRTGDGTSRCASRREDTWAGTSRRAPSPERIGSTTGRRSGDVWTSSR